MSTPEQEETEQPTFESVQDVVEHEDYYEGFPSFDDLGGLDNEIAQLKQSYLLSQHAELCQAWDVEPPRGIMLCGPGGVGKTEMIRALARDTNSILRIIQPSSILGKYVGDAESRLRDVFSDAADNYEQTILFFDEFDGLFSEEAIGNNGVLTSLISEMKVQMNQLPPHVLVTAATNSITNFDPALLRPGRFDSIIQIPMPNPETRKSIFLKYFSKSYELYDIGNLDYEQLAQHTDGMTGADINGILRSIRARRVSAYLLEQKPLSRITQNEIVDSINQHRKSRPGQ
jgi:SpoVK/Ycf46/Vps4 family AAA+-type ATPase